MPKRSSEQLKSFLSGMLDLPQDVVLDLPRLIALGKTQLYIENHKGIIEYTPERIRVNSTIGIIRLTGKDMSIKTIETEEILVSGQLTSIEFL
ncbi:sporulation protein YqfC [Mahella sp.]|uniref:sporulation protein YqfC n=1 Tax=Mahella sp. TaxID=2798721 RepID=UPI0025BD2810|nr:sporulation protein YqfC [Mahella sp.]MBZ4666146.1 hypothetical protein [Mahella sp.]MDK2902157.1 hypothetical protein [Clostridiales bacterium]